MKSGRYVSVIFAAVLAAALMAGCAAFDVGNPRALLVEEVIAMTEAGVGKDVIMRQIEVTRSRFELDARQIILLKKAGVDDDVLEAMINTEMYPNYYDREFGYSPYDYSFNYYNHWYPVSSHYPYIYHYMYPYTSYRRADLIGRFYRYAPITAPPYVDYNRRYEWRYPQRRGGVPEEDDDDD